MKRLFVAIIILFCSLPIMASLSLRHIYYTHNDHLGSASWITDDGTKPVQYLHYLPFGQLLTNQQLYTYDERFKFIGKERDQESGYDFFGARYFISPFKHWGSPDPLSDRDPSISSYAYCRWNPVRNIDALGLDVYVFDENGDFIKKEPEKGIHFGVIRKQGGADERFEFADPINDAKSIDNKEINKLIFVDNTEVDKILTASGVFSPVNKRNKYSYVLTESNSGNIKGEGRMDYVVTGKYHYAEISKYANCLFLTDVNGAKVAHNTYNFGNFLWGAGVQALGIPLPIALLGAHINNFFNDNKSKFQLDSRDDQLSIKIGYKWKK